MKIAIEGCAHGELDTIYDSIALIEEKADIKIDLLICCGDFQATRNLQDLRCMAVPEKYQKMCSFYKYYAGEKVAPVLTVFIGGNHEASNYMQELPYGGWVAPNIYYMGYASVISIGGVRIAGLSGIYKGHDYLRGHFEIPPYSEDCKRSVYHVRNLEVFRLKQLQQPVDIFLSHDWPRGIHTYGNEQRLLKQKPFFQEDIALNKLGSKPCEELLHFLKPSYWFSAHLHVKFAAIIPHDSEEEERKTTKFLALDKCLPKRKFLQVLEIPHDENKPLELQYDLEWLTILHITNHLLSVKKTFQYMPGPRCNERWIFAPTSDELDLIRRKFDNNFVIPQNFTQTVTPYCTGENTKLRKVLLPKAQMNPQTMSFCERLGVDDPMALLLKCSGGSSSLNLSTVSTCELPSFLTPERPGDVSAVTVSFDESVGDTDADTSEKHDSVQQSPVLPLPLKRLSLALPSPRHSDADESLLKFGNEDLTGSPKQSLSFPLPEKRLSVALPSPQHSDANESLLKFGNEDVTGSPKQSLSLPLPEKRLSVALLSPQHSDADESLLKFGNEDISESPNRTMNSGVGLYFPSPRDSDAEDLNHSSQDDAPSSEFLELSPIDRKTGANDTPRDTDSPQPLVKKFKRRNQALYCTTDED